MVSSNEIKPVERDRELPLHTVAGALSGTKDGKGVGDLVDEETVNEWTMSFLAGAEADSDDQSVEAAFRFGARMEGCFAPRSFVEAESDLRAEWAAGKGRVPWERVRSAVWAGFDRARDRRS